MQTVTTLASLTNEQFHRLMAIMALTHADELRELSPVGADEVNLRLKGAVPPATDRRRLWPGKITRRKRQGLADHRLDRPPAP